MKPRELAGGRLLFLGSYPGEVPRVEKPEVVFAGRSNVGKSSCINTLVGVTNAARVSSSPGRTQAINLFEVNNRYVLADLPGYGFAKVPEKVRLAWKEMVEGYLFERETIRLVFVLVDPRRDPGGTDQILIEGLRQAPLPLVVLATRCDKLNRNELNTALARLRKAYNLGPGELIAFSALDRTGRDATLEAIDRAVGP